MATAAEIALRHFVPSLVAVFGHEETVRNETASAEGATIEIDVPVDSGKMKFAIQERRAEIVAVLILSEEVVRAGILRKAQEWLHRAAEDTPQFERHIRKRVKIFIVEETRGQRIPRFQYSSAP